MNCKGKKSAKKDNTRDASVHKAILNVDKAWLCSRLDATQSFFHEWLTVVLKLRPTLCFHGILCYYVSEIVLNCSTYLALSFHSSVRCARIWVYRSRATIISGFTSVAEVKLMFAKFICTHVQLIKSSKGQKNILKWCYYLLRQFTYELHSHEWLLKITSTYYPDN